MDFNELKTNWAQLETDKKSRKELLAMIKIQNHPKLNRIRIRLIIEVIMLAAFLAAYNDIFDGPDKPLWINITLVVTAILFILADVYGYLILQNPVQESNLKQSLNMLHGKIKRLRVMSLTTSSLFGLAVILFFTSTVVFTSVKYLACAGLILMLTFMMYMSYKSWTQRMHQLKEAGMEFDEVADS